MATEMTDFSKLLNPEQCSAATAGDGPILVLAAAGTGKTRTLVHRVACLVERGVPADRILLLTFTNRAAREMLERAEKVVGPEVSAIWSGTFHSICARFLRRYGSLLGYRPGFSIIDEDDQKKILGEIIKSSVKDPKDFPKKEIVAKMISEAVNEGKSVGSIAARWLTKSAGFTPEEIVSVAEKYEARKRELGSMDFDDLLVNGLRLLKEHERVRDILQEHFLHVLVDEYQDTNSLQAEFTDIIAGRHRNILAVGDVCGKPGLDILKERLRPRRRQYGVGFCVVNGENANGVGVTPKQAVRAPSGLFTLWSKETISVLLQATRSRAKRSVKRNVFIFGQL